MNKLSRHLLFISAMMPCFSIAQVAGTTQVIEKTVISYNDTVKLSFLHDPSLYGQGWDTLGQTKFWREVINLTSDTCIINVASCRQSLQKVCRGNWMQLSEDEKKFIKDSLSCTNKLDANSTLFVTSGKEEFYELKKVLPEISKAIHVFEKAGVDPWYAQTIMLIESPGKTKVKSSVGANGPFQLMKSVARKYGLVVNRSRDDRTNLEKSAKVAAKLISVGCIANVKKYLDELSLPYNETDLWFRLLVLHAYHAGAGNVHCVLQQLHPQKGGIGLFEQIWQTECGGFKNESQNYSQIALASLSNFDELIQKDGDTVFLVRGDKEFKRYNRKTGKPWDSFQYLNSCLASYENDLVDGTIPYDYFIRRITQIRSELKKIAGKLTGENTDMVINAYPAGEEQILNLASRLMKKQRFEEAISIAKLNLEAHPNSAKSFELLANAYMKNGKKQLAAVYANRSMAARENPEFETKD
jgi:hypothetical protein